MDDIGYCCYSFVPFILSHLAWDFCFLWGSGAAMQVVQALPTRIQQGRLQPSYQVRVITDVGLCCRAHCNRSSQSLVTGIRIQKTEHLHVSKGTEPHESHCYRRCCRGGSRTAPHNEHIFYYFPMPPLARVYRHSLAKHQRQRCHLWTGSHQNCCSLLPTRCPPCPVRHTTLTRPGVLRWGTVCLCVTPCQSRRGVHLAPLRPRGRCGGGLPYRRRRQLPIRLRWGAGCRSLRAERWQARQ